MRRVAVASAWLFFVTLPAVAADAVGAYQPLWFRGAQSTSQAQAVLAQLRSAADYGLRSEDYGVAALEAMIERLRRDPLAPAQAIAEADRALSTAASQLAWDLHFGRVDPKACGFAIEHARAPLDGPALLARLAGSRYVAAEFAALEPPFLHYRLLKTALRRYHELAQQPALTQLPPLPAHALRPGDRYVGAPALRRLLSALGDLPAGEPTAPVIDDHVLDGDLARGLTRFQSRHGLSADGVLARKTYQALTVPLSVRAHQIELTLERWRWLPPFTAPPVVVNIPQFQLFAFRTTEDRAADITQMRVIVGEAYRRKRTPVFISEMRYIVFRPYWDVPASILHNEMLAPMRANPGYLARNDLEIVNGGGDDAAVVAATPENIEALAAGRLRLRQRPGPDNSLGLIKFVMPNDYGVYLHSTPARHLFDKPRRDFSHGCIRVSDPVALAVHALRGNPGDWSADAVIAAMNGARTQRVMLASPIPVMVLYGTALATEAGPVMFFDDIYGHDRHLDAMLRARRLGGRI
jgi:murein L,D-transpeptidase YcbB/YkuD